MENNNTLCIEDIMEEIRRDIKEKNLTSDMLSFEDVPYKRAEDTGVSADELQSSMIYVNSHYNVQPYKALGGNPLYVFVKKVIRRLTKFYVEPVVFEQNDFNAHTVRILNAMNGSGASDISERLEEALSRIEVLELKQKNLTAQLEMLRKENEALKEKTGKQEL